MSTMLCNILSLLCNLAAVILTVYAMIQFFVSTGSGNMKVTGIRCMKYFTMESNVLAAITSLVMLFENVRIFFGAEAISHGVLVFKLVGTVSVAVTLVVVLVFLGPTMGYDKMFEGRNLYLHLINPLLCLVSFIFFECGFISLTDALPALLPIILYGIVYLIMVVFIGAEKGGWQDFYGFNRGGHWIRTLLAMSCANPVFVLVIVKLHNLFG